MKVAFARGRARTPVDERLGARDLEHDLATSLGDRVIISRDGGEVFCYTGTREQAQRAEKLISSPAGEHDWHLQAALRRWHPEA